MKVQNLMSHDVVTCSPQDWLQEVAQNMRTLDIGSMPVVENDKVIGMITDRDIVTRGVAKDTQGKVKDVMTAKVISVTSDTTADEAAELMAKHKVRRLPVIDNGSLVGFIALADLSVPDPSAYQADTALHQISEPRHP